VLLGGFDHLGRDPDMRLGVVALCVEALLQPGDGIPGIVARCRPCADTRHVEGEWCFHRLITN
jgi:hypothetical protein